MQNTAMKKSTRSGVLTVALVFLVMVAGCVQESSESTQNGDRNTQKAQPADQKEIVAAIVSSLTGDLASNGKDMANGAQMALDEAIAGGVFKGYKVRVALFDDQAAPKTAVSVAQRVCNDSSIRIVVGHLTSGCMGAAAPVYAKAGMPVVMPVPTDPEITEQGRQNLFRVPPRDDEQAPFLARYLLKLDKSAPVAIVHDLTAYGQGFAEAFRKDFESGGGNIVDFEGAQKETGDFRTLIAKLKGLTPKYVVLGATYDMGAPFARQMKEMGLNATIVSGDGCYGTAYLEQAGSAAEGTIVSFIAPGRESSPEATRFFDQYEAKYGKVVSFAPLGYDAGKVAVDALRRVLSPTRDNLVSTIRASDFSVSGVTGQITFDEKGDNKNKNLLLYVAKNGKFAPLT